MALSNNLETRRKQLKKMFAQQETVHKDPALKQNKPNPVPNKYRPRVRIKVQKGVLGQGKPGFFKLPTSIRRRRETQLARKEGEQAIVGRIRAIKVFHKNTNPSLSKKAASDARYIAGSFKGKKVVGFPKGFSPNARRK